MPSEPHGFSKWWGKRYVRGAAGNCPPGCVWGAYLGKNSHGAAGCQAIGSVSVEQLSGLCGHALLLTATTPPSGRTVLVNGFDATIDTPAGSLSISSREYSVGSMPGVVMKRKYALVAPNRTAKNRKRTLFSSPNRPRRCPRRPLPAESARASHPFARRVRRERGPASAQMCTHHAVEQKTRSHAPTERGAAGALEGLTPFPVRSWRNRPARPVAALQPQP